MSYDTIKYWRNRFQSYGSVNTTSEKVEKIKPFEEELVLKYTPPESTLLDFGVGTGRMFPLYERLKCKVSGYDIADFRFLIEAKREKHPNFEYEHIIEDSIKKLPFSDMQFNTCVCFAVLLHQNPGYEIEFVTSELVRVAKYVIASVYEPVEKGRPLDNHCFEHNYKALFKELGITIIAEKRVNAKSIFYIISK